MNKILETLTTLLRSLNQQYTKDPRAYQIEARHRNGSLLVKIEIAAPPFKGMEIIHHGKAFPIRRVLVSDQGSGAALTVIVGKPCALPGKRSERINHPKPEKSVI